MATKKRKPSFGSGGLIGNTGSYRPGAVGAKGQSLALTMPKPSPARPPAGFYDPMIDSQVSAGQRGLGDFRIDYDTAKRRGSEDYQSTLADLLTTETRTNQDYGTATANLGLNFQRLGRQQAEGARTRGILSAGLAGKSAQIRGANQAREQTGLDTQHDRALADITTRRGLLDRDYQRQFAPGGDLDLQLTRAEREQPFLETDANTQRVFQAQQAGYIPPTGTVGFGGAKNGKYKWPDGKGYVHSRPYRGG